MSLYIFGLKVKGNPIVLLEEEVSERKAMLVNAMVRKNYI